MARMRSLKPELWADRKLASKNSRDARLLYMALWNFADEHGRLNGDARYIKGHCLPYDDDLGLPAIERLLNELAASGRLVRYEVDGDPYLWLPKLAQHQRLEPHKVPSRLPAPPLTCEDIPPAPDPEPSDPDESESRADESARRANESAPRANSSEKKVAKHVAGGREHVAGSRAAKTKPRADEPRAGKGSKHETADTLTAQWWERHKASTAQTFLAIRGVVRTAIGNGLDPEAVSAAMERLAAEGKPLSGGTLQFAMSSPPRLQVVNGSGPAPSRNAQILAAAMERARAAEGATS